MGLCAEGKPQATQLAWPGLSSVFWEVWVGSGLAYSKNIGYVECKIIKVQNIHVLYNLL